jgi:hypothetical protein
MSELFKPREGDASGADHDCPWRDHCANAGSWRCRFCHRDYGNVESWHQFKDKEYYRKTLPFIEVQWLFVQAGKGQGA